MAKLRKFTCYRRLERPYTRISKYRQKAFVRANPHSTIVRFTMGAPNKKFSHRLELIAKGSVQIRHNAIESARTTSNKVLEERLGKNGFHMKIRMYPFHVLRENPLASGAGADRFSTGMTHSFGKPIGSAAQVKTGKVLFEVHVNKSDLQTARLAMDRARHKLPCHCSVIIKENIPNK